MAAGGCGGDQALDHNWKCLLSAEIATIYVHLGMSVNQPIKSDLNRIDYKAIQFYIKSTLRRYQINQV